MRDDRQPFRLADLSLAAPLLPSLFMAVYGVMSQPNQAVLPVLLSVHAVCMAWAAATASGRAASRVGFWVQRQAPVAALVRERRQWWHMLLWAVGCGLLGPVVLAGRLGSAQQWSPALWVASVTLLGGALGALAGFAWFGMAARRALWAWPALLVSGLLLPVVWPRLLEASWLSGLLAALVLCASVGAGRMALRAAQQTVPLWAGMRQKPGVLPDPAVRTNPKRRLDALAFDSGPEGHERSGLQGTVNRGLTFALVMPGMLFFSEPELNGWWLLGLFVCQLLLFAFCGFGLVAVDEHRRLRLAPQGLTQSSRVAVLLVGSAYLWLLNAGVLTLMTAMILNVWDRLELLVPLATDVLLAVACAAWLRGVANRRSAVAAGALGYALAHVAFAGAWAALGQPLERGPTFAVWQTALALLVFAAAWRRWMRRSVYGRSFRPFA